MITNGKDTGERKVIATIWPSMSLPRSKCGDIFNFGYAVVSYMNAKVLEELVKITDDLEKPSPNHQTPATPRKGREAGKVEVRRSHRNPVETKKKKFALTSTLPTPRGDRDEDRAEGETIWFRSRRSTVMATPLSKSREADQVRYDTEELGIQRIHRVPVETKMERVSPKEIPSVGSIKRR